VFNDKEYLKDIERLLTRPQWIYSIRSQSIFIAIVSGISLGIKKEAEE
jgi:hypothetical protein